MSRELKTLSMRNLEESFLDDDLLTEQVDSDSQKTLSEANAPIGNITDATIKKLDPSGSLKETNDNVTATDATEKKAEGQVDFNKTGSLSLDKSVSQQATKSEAVQDHPLARRSSNSSSSSTEGDYPYEHHSFEQTPKNIRGERLRGSSFGRLRGFIGMPDETEGMDGAGYYNSASALWQNRSKIFTNLKKHASDGVRRNLPGLSNSSSFEVSIPDPVNTESTPIVTQQSSNQVGLFKVETDKIVESKEDTEVASFLHGLKGKVVDPLQLLYYKKKEEDERKKEMEDFSQPVKRNVTPQVRNESEDIFNKKSEPDRPVQPKVSTTPSSLSMSLSALLGGAALDQEEEKVERELEILDTVVNNEDETLNTDAINNNDLKVVECSKTKPEPSEADVAIESPSFPFVLSMVFLVYTYLVYPVPFPVQLIVTSFVFGTLFTSVFLCIVAPQSTRPRPILNSVINRTVPNEVPKSIFNPDQPIKGWMNESPSYDPELYHVSNTHSVFVTLDGSTLRLQRPNKSITRRSIYNEGNIPVSNVIFQRLYDITHAKVYLKPDGLVKKRVWSKKYPICVEIPVKHKTDQEVNKEPTDKQEGNAEGEENIIIYLFGRTDRQKEEWFYRIQRSINLSLRKQKLAEKEKARSKDNVDDSSVTPIIEDEWGVIENHYEEETFVASTLCKVETVKVDPVRAYRDYFVHVSRLFPEPLPPTYSDEKRTKEKTESNASETSEPGLEVAWLNVFVGRVMFDFLRQEGWAKWLSVKIQKKLDKIKLPYFMEELKLTEMNLGSTVPLIHQISLPKLDARGIWMEMEITYSGSLQMTLKTKMVLTKLGKQELQEDAAKQSWKKTSAITDSDAEDSAESSDDDESTVSRLVDQVHTAVPQIVKDAVKYVGTETGSPPNNPPANPNAPKKWVRIVDSIAKSKYFKKATESEYIRKKLETVSNTPMLLSVELLELKGTVAVNIPPPPTDRLWYGFREPPHIVLKAHPKVGERVVKTSHITDWIENKLQQEFVKVLVMPNMDDIPIPIMFNNR